MILCKVGARRGRQRQDSIAKRRAELDKTNPIQG